MTIDFLNAVTVSVGSPGVSRLNLIVYRYYKYVQVIHNMCSPRSPYFTIDILRKVLWEGM